MSFEEKRVYITVKTYPTISQKYSELVCTAGLLEDGSWIRLYPIPFNQLKDEQKYHKYTWIRAEVERNTSDFRLESYRPDLATITPEPRPKLKKADWDERIKIISKSKIYTNLQKLIEKAKTENISLAVFKPKEILRFVHKPDKREWDQTKVEMLRAQSLQLTFFQTIEEIEADFRIAQKIPYKFSYQFVDDSGKKSTLMIEDWEIGMLYLHCLSRAGGNEEKAIAKVKERYFDYFLQRDIYFFLGTTFQHHRRSRDPFIIIGVFYPPMPQEETQLSLF